MLQFNGVASEIEEGFHTTFPLDIYNHIPPRVWCPSQANCRVPRFQPITYFLFINRAVHVMMGG